MSDKEQDSVTCSICCKEFSNEKRYFGHLKTHTDHVDQFISSQKDLCISQENLKDSDNCFYLPERPFRCALCDDVFEKSVQLEYHKRSVHLQEKSQTCQICGKGFFRKSDLQTHLNVHLGTNQFICEICGRKFNHVSNLIRHSRMHAGCKPYPCTVCAKRFSQTSSLIRHKRTHYQNAEKNEKNISGSENVQDSPRVEEKKRTKRQHYCRICGENFQFMVLLRQHRRSHAKSQATSDEYLSNVQQEKRKSFDDNINSIRKPADNFVGHNLVEFTEKVNSGEAERDASISDILSFYNSNVTELSDQEKGKEFDIAQCLNSIDFGSNICQPMDFNNVNLQEDPESSSKRHRFFLVDQQLYVEVQESKALNSKNVELSKRQNVEIQENCFHSKESKTKNQIIDSSQNIIAEKLESSNVDHNHQLEEKEPTLRLVRTETGDEFYELVVNDQQNGLEEIENVEENRSTKEKNLWTSEKENLERSAEETPNVQIIQNYENCNEVPMVRLVQNEDGEQFFELVREPPECEKNPSPEKNELTATANVETSSSKPEKKENNARNGPKVNKDPVRKFKCEECNKWFSTAYNFEQHAGTHFADKQKFYCEHCGLSFAWKSTLNKHLAGKHRPDGPQKFVCQICPKVYGTLSQVNEHVKRDHLKERKHVCTLCGKSFFKKFDLKTHSRTHTKERPYVCRACGKAFHYQSHIIRHERIHSGERPYECNICQKTFTQPGSLKSHRLRHRDVKIDILEYRMNEDDPLTLPVI